MDLLLRVKEISSCFLTPCSAKGFFSAFLFYSKKIEPTWSVLSFTELSVCREERRRKKQFQLCRGAFQKGSVRGLGSIVNNTRISLNFLKIWRSGFRKLLKLEKLQALHRYLTNSYNIIYVFITFRRIIKARVIQ